MIERDLIYLAVAFLVGVALHRFVLAGVKKLFGWVVKK